ncbi:helix-turn-helix domain-containing protein [Lachnospiraceae bacterium ZAX-1]
MKYYSQKDVARRIKQVRMSAGMTQSELAEELDVTENNIYRLESGKSGYTVDRLVEIAQILIKILCPKCLGLNYE